MIWDFKMKMIQFMSLSEIFRPLNPSASAWWLSITTRQHKKKKKRPPPQAQLQHYTPPTTTTALSLSLSQTHPPSRPSPPLPFLTCVLSELVHGMQIDDVGREARVHLAEDDTTTARVAPDDCLDVMTDSRAVGPPASVLVQPFPYHYGGC